MLFVEVHHIEYLAFMTPTTDLQKFVYFLTPHF